MNLWYSFAGMIEVELTSADPEQTFTEIGALNIEIRAIRKHSDLTYSFLIPRRKGHALMNICNKRGDTVKIRKRIGLYWIGRKAVTRPILLIGLICFFLMALWLPTRVFFVRVEGNEQIPDRQILAAAEACGIVFGASRREVRSERVKNALISAIPELQWAGVNTTGCTARISVREKAETEARENIGEFASMLASRDGYVLSCTATAGNLLVKPGESVRKDQVLISSYTDCGLCIRAERAEGEVIAQTNRSLEAVMPSHMVVKGDTTRIKRKYSMLLRKKRIFLWKDSGIWDDSCGRMYEEHYITLPGGYQLPIAFCVETYTFADMIPTDIPEKDAECALKGFVKGYLHQHMIAGKILSGMQTMKAENGRYRLSGEYACVEMIGTMRQEQIGDTNGENS